MGGGWGRKLRRRLEEGSRLRLKAVAEAIRL